MQLMSLATCQMQLTSTTLRVITSHVHRLTSACVAKKPVARATAICKQLHLYKASGRAIAVDSLARTHHIEAGAGSKRLKRRGNAACGSHENGAGLARGDAPCARLQRCAIVAQDRDCRKVVWQWWTQWHLHPRPTVNNIIRPAYSRPPHSALVSGTVDDRAPHAWSSNQ